VKVDKIDLASLPEGFNEEEAMRWYVAQLALAFGGDYQDFAPLPTSASAGSGSQSRVMHQKSLSKGSRLFMQMVTQIMNYRGIIPSSIQFSYEESDPQEDAQLADLKLTRAKERQVRILSGELNLAIARQVAVDEGDLKPEYILQLNEEPTTEDITIEAYQPVDAEPELIEIGDPDKYEGTPEEQTSIPGATSWGTGSVNGGDTSNSPKKGTTSGGNSTGSTGATQKPVAAKKQPAN
jgi:hypothetical protein